MSITFENGITVQPPAFSEGLDVWSSGDGRPSDPSYDTAANAAFVPADQDFGGCLELEKQQTTTKLRYTGETPILPGCYLQIKARVKLISGIFPSVRIAGFAAAAGGGNVVTVDQTGPSTFLNTYGKVVEVSAIVGTGDRIGVDMPWGLTPVYGHFGLDFTGPNGAVVRVDDIEITDVTTLFQSNIVGRVDVLDYGAVPDGVTDSRAAFEAADQAAQGREIFVPKGSYVIGDNLTIDNKIEFQGTLIMPTDKKLVLVKNYDLPTYIDAFGDEVLAFKKAFQALIGFSDHASLDMGGRRIVLTEPIDMQAAVATTDIFTVRRAVRNGQFSCQESPAWDPTVQTSQATYSVADSKALTNVTNIANIPVGSLVEGTGVGREVYVNAVDIPNKRITLTQELYGAAGTQVFTFKRFKYALDFIGFADLGKFVLDEIEFNFNSVASGIMLPTLGGSFQVVNSSINKPKDRAITSAGTGCQNLTIHSNRITSADINTPVEQRTSIGINTNNNDVYIRDNLIIRFKHFAVLGGTGSIISGNHWFQGDGSTQGVREGGIVFANTSPKTFVTGNYIDNSFLEWTNEYEAEPENANQFSFGGLVITGNTFTVNNVAPWFRFIVVKPYGPNHRIKGLTVSSNVFRALAGKIDRIEEVDTTFSDLNYTAMKNILFEGNSFDNVTTATFNPHRAIHEEPSEQSTWAIDCAPYLPFGGNARWCEGIVPMERISNSSGARVKELPYVLTNQGPNDDQLHVKWSEACKGSLSFVARMDRPD